MFLTRMPTELLLMTVEQLGRFDLVRLAPLHSRLASVCIPLLYRVVPSVVINQGGKPRHLCPPLNNPRYASHVRCLRIMADEEPSYTLQDSEVAALPNLETVRFTFRPQARIRYLPDMFPLPAHIAPSTVVFGQSYWLQRRYMPPSVFERMETLIHVEGLYDSFRDQFDNTLRGLPAATRSMVVVVLPSFRKGTKFGNRNMPQRFICQLFTLCEGLVKGVTDHTKLESVTVTTPEWLLKPDMIGLVEQAIGEDLRRGVSGRTERVRRETDSACGVEVKLLPMKEFLADKRYQDVLTKTELDRYRMMSKGRRRPISRRQLEYMLEHRGTAFMESGLTFDPEDQASDILS